MRRFLFAAGVTQWEYPSELQATETAAEEAAPVWVKGVDPDSGHPYWCVSLRQAAACVATTTAFAKASPLPETQLLSSHP